MAGRIPDLWQAKEDAGRLYQLYLSRLQTNHQHGVRREELLKDAAHLEIFFNKLMEVWSERTTSGVTRGQWDLIESPAKVRKWQQATAEKLAQFEERIRPTTERIDAKLRNLFPELHGDPELNHVG